MSHRNDPLLTAHTFIHTPDYTRGRRAEARFCTATEGRWREFLARANGRGGMKQRRKTLEDESHGRRNSGEGEEEKEEAEGVENGWWKQGGVALTSPPLSLPPSASDGRLIDDDKEEGWQERHIGRNHHHHHHHHHHYRYQRQDERHHSQGVPAEKSNSSLGITWWNPSEKLPLPPYLPVPGVLAPRRGRGSRGGLVVGFENNGDDSKRQGGKDDDNGRERGLKEKEREKGMVKMGNKKGNKKKVHKDKENKKGKHKPLRTIRHVNDPWTTTTSRHTHQVAGVDSDPLPNADAATTASTKSKRRRFLPPTPSPTPSPTLTPTPPPTSSTTFQPPQTSRTELVRTTTLLRILSILHLHPTITPTSTQILDELQTDLLPEVLLLGYTPPDILAILSFLNTHARYMRYDAALLFCGSGSTCPDADGDQNGDQNGNGEEEEPWWQVEDREWEVPGGRTVPVGWETMGMSEGEMRGWWTSREREENRRWERWRSVDIGPRKLELRDGW